MSVTTSLASLATATASATPTTSLIARAVAAASTSDPCPKITISLTTVLTISAFPFPTPSGASLENYRPKYKPALADGSIITDYYATDLALANIRLLGVGALLMYFIVSTINAIRYLRRSRAKDKTLFYLLVASQIPGPICFLALGISWFNENASCTVINIVASLCIEISYSILITGILGLKVYRVFNQSKIILAVVTALQIAAFAVFALDLPNIDSMRRVSGSCDTRGTMKFMPISIILTFIESLVCSLAFLFAVWKMSRRPDTQGRISLALSLEENMDATSNDRRGWWDYVPNENDNTPQDQQSQRFSTAPAQDGASLWRMGSLLSRFGNKPPQPSDPSPSLERKSSLPTDRPLPQPRPPLRRDQLDTMEKPPRRHRHSSSVGHEPPRLTPIHPIQANYNRRSSHNRLPRMLLMRAVIRSELFYTTGIMLSCVVAAVISVIAAANANVTFGPSIWLGANWAITSLLVMRSFEMVVRRQDKETYMQSPSAWYPAAGPDNAPTTSFRPRRMPTSPNLRLRRHQVDSYDDSSEFVGPLDEETGQVITDPFGDFAASRNSSPPSSPRWAGPPIARGTLAPAKTPSRRTGSPPAPLALTDRAVATSSAVMIVPGSPAAHDLDANVVTGLPNPYSIQAEVASPESPALVSEFEPSPTQSEMRLKL